MVSFEEATIRGIASDRGLYFPEKIEKLPLSFFEEIEYIDNHEIAFQIIHPFIGNEIPEKELREIIQKTIIFDFPIVPVTDSIFALELFHGPTMAFKDVGARFMANCLAYFQKQQNKKSTILVATSGDTGGAVASGFLGVENVTVVILYPIGKVSHFQELQLTTLGNNIRAVAVEGTFDTCQEMVKNAFLEEHLTSLHLTSANSINIARWLPQMFYFFFAYKALKKYGKDIVLSCPSGNFGNICAGLLAKKLGLPIHHFIAATNSNATIPRFLNNNNYEPLPTVATLSNAMDVSNPSNFVRIMELYQNNMEALKKDFSATPYNDEQTLAIMKKIHETTGYILEPHGAIGYLALENYLSKNPDKIGIFLETAHPIKFSDTVEDNLAIQLPIPEQIQPLLKSQKVHHYIKNYEELKSFLLSL